MNISLLTQQPISGTILERHFSVFRGANLWVRFEDDVEEPWIGVFGMGDVSPYCAAVPFDDDGGRTVLVVAGGQGYIVDRISGTLLRETGWFYSYSALAPPTRDFVIVADTQHIWACRRDNDDARATGPAFLIPMQDIHQVALDGIVFERSTDAELIGFVEYPYRHSRWHRFRLHYDDMHLEVGERVEGDVQGQAPYGGYPPRPEYWDQMLRYHLV